MTLQRMIDECCERLDYYEENPQAPNATIYVHALSNRIESMLKLQLQDDKENFYT